ncbi:Hypothetical protein DEACI_1285 [Acididesulfobacillus acetoxydans]|uniref:Bacterial extracellular solute-binding protein n=1 Tax=Acididesulfobacillus acetoxydans TaxID=1561005 RepID=A0A8S0WF32_9FIRM|nr:hypothetical protein [Acididesulfobacillus acetoxydans]CAA7600632.1 Hypothetical protein DEACI_1285 [Acididesulfobacillus acetoxydans]CEJ09413.1 Bacterial extracellular solute-binding protein [Acididesulfobacillus acetoxydans]
MAIPVITSPQQQEAAFQWIKFFTGTDTTSDWPVKTGCIAVRKSATESKTYKEFAASHPLALVPFQQAMIASPQFIDTTGGKIIDALHKVADQLGIENITRATA